jgi:histidine triad (HIT) family protein
MAGAAATTCFVCAKHRAGDEAQGGVVYRDELVYAGHVHTMGGESAYRGHLVAEPCRHVEGIGLLDDAEAARLGWLTNRLAAVLRSSLRAERVSLAVRDGAGLSPRSPAHLHVHVVPRYAGTPPEYRGPAVTRWTGGPRVDATSMRDLVRELAAAFERLGPAP